MDRRHCIFVQCSCAAIELIILLKFFFDPAVFGLARMSGPKWSNSSQAVLLLLLKQEAQLSPSDRAMRLVSSNLANYHATVQNYLYDKS